MILPAKRQSGSFREHCEMQPALAYVVIEWYMEFKELSDRPGVPELVKTEAIPSSGMDLLGLRSPAESIAYSMLSVSPLIVMYCVSKTPNRLQPALSWCLFKGLCSCHKSKPSWSLRFSFALVAQFRYDLLSRLESWAVAFVEVTALRFLTRILRLLSGVKFFLTTTAHRNPLFNVTLSEAYCPAPHSNTGTDKPRTLHSEHLPFGQRQHFTYCLGR